MQHTHTALVLCPAETRKAAGAQGPGGAQARKQRKRKGPASTAAALAETAAGEGCVAVPFASEAGPSVQAGDTLEDWADAALAMAELAEVGAGQ